MFTSYITYVIFTVAWLLVLDRMVFTFLQLLISWFPAQESIGFTQRSEIKKILKLSWEWHVYRLKNCLLMLEVNREWPDRFELTERLQRSRKARLYNGHKITQNGKNVAWSNESWILLRNINQKLRNISQNLEPTVYGARQPHVNRLVGVM